jgi:hypothetical protein
MILFSCFWMFVEVVDDLVFLSLSSILRQLIVNSASVNRQFSVNSSLVNRQFSVNSSSFQRQFSVNSSSWSICGSICSIELIQSRFSSLNPEKR